jgi:starch phosphorylase
MRNHYYPPQLIDEDSDLQAVMRLLESGYFNAREAGIFDNIINAMKSPSDPWMTLADFRSYVDAQQRVNEAWHYKHVWTRMSILNTACSGFFSTDRTMEQYNEEIWKLKPVPVGE